MKQLVYYIKKNAKNQGVKIRLTPYKNINFNGSRINGYFDCENKILQVATKKKFKEWFFVFIHEAAHLFQWIEKDKSLKPLIDKRGNDISYKIDDWMNGGNVAEIQKIMLNTYRMELNCEKRAVSLIKKFNVKINVEEYIQKANAYMCYHFLMLEFRKRYKSGKEPWSISKIWKTMPKRLNVNHQKIYEQNKDLFILCLK